MTDTLNDLQYKYYSGVGTINLGTVVSQPINSVGQYTGSIVITTPKSVGTLTSAINGLMRYITITTPDLTGTGTATVTIVDSAGGTHFSQAQDESAITTYGSIVPIVNTMKFIATADGTQSATGTVLVNVFYER